MAWRWTARRWAISAFVLFHLSALVMWTMPPCTIKAQFQSPNRYYVLPLGLWQWWAIFAPDPMRRSMVLNAEVVDAKGMRYSYEFPRLADGQSADGITGGVQFEQLFDASAAQIGVHRALHDWE